MPYIKETCVAGKTIEVRKYHSYRYGVKGQIRSKRKKPTKEQQRQINLKNATTQLRRILNATFADENGDILLTLDYKPEYRPKDSTEMQKHAKEFFRRMRREYARRGVILKYVYTKEIGPRGASHIHAVITHIDTKVIKRCWDYGGFDAKPLWTDGQYAKIANYFVKYSAKTEETEGKLVGKRYYASRNVIRPEPVKEIITRSNSFRATPREEKGYYIEKDSIQRGINELGYEYLAYTLHANIERSEKYGEKKRTRAPAGSRGQHV